MRPRAPGFKILPRSLRLTRLRAHSSTAEQGTHNPLVPGSNPGGPNELRQTGLTVLSTVLGRVSLTSESLTRRMHKRPLWSLSRRRDILPALIFIIIRIGLNMQPHLPLLLGARRCLTWTIVSWLALVLNRAQPSPLIRARENKSIANSAPSVMEYPAKARKTTIRINW